MTAPALLDSQCAAADAHVSEGAPANCDDDAVQAAMAEQDDGDLILDDVNSRCPRPRAAPDALGPATTKSFDSSSSSDDGGS